MPADTLHLNLDDAWPVESVPCATLDARADGPALRFSTPPRVIEKFYADYTDRLASFLLYGSGDFHHLTGLWLRRVTRPFTLVSFDNHPDWDIRPPKWCCGSWINRALDLPLLHHAAVWGCGNFECWWPGKIFGNRRDTRSGRLEVRPWADERSASDQQRAGSILRCNWRKAFEKFAETLKSKSVYVTIDLDCLCAEEAATNWENGRFNSDDLVWALGQLRQHGEIIAGDICGGYSMPVYARRKQRFASEMDHPKLPDDILAQAGARNLATLRKLWPALTG